MTCKPDNRDYASIEGVRYVRSHGLLINSLDFDVVTRKIQRRETKEIGIYPEP